MIKRLLLCRSRSFDPYENLALEEALLSRVGEGELILYLWQNECSVVIGRNQNPWKECRTALLAEEGGCLARRLSGGGAVFHDRGNLNFTFLMTAGDYDLPRQLTVLERACQSLGIPARRSGRNDLLADGRKFSGNAFYKHNGKAYHHGTLMLDVDMEMVQRYLSPSKAKLAAKGVDSVRSRVVNLREFVPDLTIPQLADALIAALAEVYAVAAHSVRHIEATGNRQQATDPPVAPAICRPASPHGRDIRDQASANRHQASGDGETDSSTPLRSAQNDGRGSDSAVGGGVLDAPRTPAGAAIDRPPKAPAFQACHSERSEESVPSSSVQTLAPEEFDLRELRAKYASDAWLYGPKLPFTLSVEDRFPWGGIELQLQVEGGVIRAARVYTDAMDETLAPRLEAAFWGCPFRLPALQARLEALALPTEQAEPVLSLLKRSL